jgi:mannose-6-phosphate isomerase
MSKNGTVADHLASFAPKNGEGIFIPAGTVHSLGTVVVFEVQENSGFIGRPSDIRRIRTGCGSPPR